MSSDGGLMLLRDFEKSFGVTKRFANYFTDYRKQDQWIGMDRKIN